MMQTGKIEYAPNYGQKVMRVNRPGDEWTGAPPVNGGTVYDHPRNVPKLNLDSIARRYVERSDDDAHALETFSQPLSAANDNDPLAVVRAMRGYHYLGSPYSLYRGGLQTAARRVSNVAADLMRRGLVVYSPICHGHAIASYNDLPTEWEFWKRQCLPLLQGAKSLIVAKMDGWRESVGLRYEIDWAHEAYMPVVYLDVGEDKLEAAA